MDLHTLLLTNNNCYKSGKKIKPAGIMVHSTGANNPNLCRYVGPDDGLLGPNTGNNDWNRPLPDNREVCVHGFIGKLKSGAIAAYQTLPWEMRGWHAGGKANDTHIGFEICEDALTDAGYFAKVYQEAVDLCAMLCVTYNIKPEKPSLICHSEGYTLGIASNHSDVMHWFPKFNKSMDTFRADVKAAITKAADDKAQTADTAAAPAAKPAVKPAAKPKPAKPVVKTPEEITVDNAIADGIITEREHWLGVLTGTIKPNTDYIKIMMDNAHTLLVNQAADKK
ncbi:MAG: peptidoglycan recognition protein family protein [Clostridiales bacterium]|nr:peptidoglycan recognition protein family protein [Clostridiales bacterium]